MPSSTLRGGRPPVPDWVCLDAIVYVLRTGCPWKALDATVFCPGSTAHDRFPRWVRDGVFLQFWQVGRDLQHQPTARLVSCKKTMFWFSSMNKFISCISAVGTAFTTSCISSAVL